MTILPFLTSFAVPNSPMSNEPLVQPRDSPFPRRFTRDANHSQGQLQFASHTSRFPEIVGGHISRPGCQSLTRVPPAKAFRRRHGSRMLHCHVRHPARVTRLLARPLRHTTQTPQTMAHDSPSHHPARTSTASVACRFGVPFRVGTFQGLPAPTTIASGPTRVRSSDQGP